MPLIHSRRVTNLIALLAYGLVSFLYFGLPVAAHPGRVVIGSAADPNIFIWSLAWWPHALLHGLNPIYTHAIWAPSGFNLAWATSIPGLALAFAPLTLLVGPVVAYNVASILMPALAAWTTFLLCRYLTRSILPSLAGGYLFGFSSYMLGHEEGHLNLTAVFLVPLVALVVLRSLHAELSRYGTTWRLGLLLAAQLSISTEVFGTLTLAIVVSLAIAFGLVRAGRARLRSLVAPLVSGYAIAAVLMSPLLYYVFTGFPTRPFGPTHLFVTDAVNIFIPTHTAALGGGDVAGDLAGHFSGNNELEQNAYLGIPMLVIVAFVLLRRQRSQATRFLIVLFGAAVVASFGSALHVYGHETVPMPWWLVARLPAFENIYPCRVMMYASLAAAVLVALWAAAGGIPQWLRIGLPALAILALFPNLGDHRWDQTPQVPAFIAKGDYETCMSPGENVLAIPYGYHGHALLWQALSDFEFRLAGGQIGRQVPSSFANEYDEIHPIDGLLAGGLPLGEGGSVIDLAKKKGVSRILIDQSDPWPWTSVLAGLGRPARIGGVFFYSVGRTTAPNAGCGAKGSRE